MPNPALNHQPFAERIPFAATDINANDEHLHSVSANWSPALRIDVPPTSMLGNLGKLRKLDVRASQGTPRNTSRDNTEDPPLNNFPLPYPDPGDGEQNGAEQENITELLREHHKKLVQSVDTSLDDWMVRHEASFTAILEGSVQQLVKLLRPEPPPPPVSIGRNISPYNDIIAPITLMANDRPRNWGHNELSRQSFDWTQSASSASAKSLKGRELRTAGRMSAEKLVGNQLNTVDEQLQHAQRAAQINSGRVECKNDSTAEHSRPQSTSAATAVGHMRSLGGTKKGDRDRASKVNTRRKSDALKVAERLTNASGLFNQESDAPRKRRCCLQRCASYISKQPLFDAAITFAIFTNSAFIGLQVEVVAQQQTNDTHMSIVLTQWLYALIFFIELIIRLVAEELNFFLGVNKGWNLLDLAIVATSLVEAIMDVVVITGDGSSDANSGAGSVSSVRIIRILRLARLFRVIRVIRIARFIHALRTFVYSIIYTLRSLLWAMVLLFMITYIFGIMFTQATGDYNIDVSKEPDRKVSEDYVLQRYWGSLPRSMFTLFKSISGGLSWDLVVHALGHLSPVWVTVFTCYIMFTYFAVLNVIVGVFCQSAIETAAMNEDLLVSAQMNAKQMYMERIRKLFKDIDEDNSGMITITEFEEHLLDESVQAFLGSMDIETDDAWTLFQLLDPDGSNFIDVEEFVTGIFRLKGNAKRVDLVQMHSTLKRTWALLVRLLNNLPNHQQMRDNRSFAGGTEQMRENRSFAGTGSTCLRGDAEMLIEDVATDGHHHLPFSSMASVRNNKVSMSSKKSQPSNVGLTSTIESEQRASTPFTLIQSM